MSINTFYEISTDDIENAVYNLYDKHISWEQADIILDELNQDEIAKVAQYYDNIQDQTDAVMKEISEHIVNDKTIQELIKTF
tara:strand:+ start:207 stop:452 length:246 start_codon:yes stop_codon:yes gene_type:complete